MHVRSSSSASEQGAPSVFTRHIFLPCVFAHSLSWHLINVKYGFKTVAGEEEGARRRLLLQYLSPACIFKKKPPHFKRTASSTHTCSHACVFNVSCRVLHQAGQVMCRRMVCDCDNPNADLFCCPECDPRLSSQCLHQNGLLTYGSGDTWVENCQQCQCLVSTDARLNLPPPQFSWVGGGLLNAFIPSLLQPEVKKNKPHNKTTLSCAATVPTQSGNKSCHLHGDAREWEMCPVKKIFF